MQSASPVNHNPIPLYALFTANAISLVGNVFTMMIGLAITTLITTFGMAFIPAMKEMNRKVDSTVFN